MNVGELQTLSPVELDELFHRGSARPPAGCFRGRHLCSIVAPQVDNAFHRTWQHIGFELMPFGVDFDRACWVYFGRVRVGHFRALSGPSRWRDTEAVQLHYDVSRLPRVLRRHLYDELVALDDSLLLGIGGLNAPRGRGEHFFFALERE